MSEKKNTRMMQLFEGIHDLDLLKWVNSEGQDCPARLRRALVSLASSEIKRREHEIREQQACQRAVAAEIIEEKKAIVNDNPLAAPLQRALALVKAVWMQSGEGTAVISDLIERAGGDANHWSGVESWVMGDSDTPADSRDLAQLRAEVDQLWQEVEFWKSNAVNWRDIALQRRVVVEGETS
jgi:hypothetical protein